MSLKDVLTRLKLVHPEEGGAAPRPAAAPTRGPAPPPARPAGRSPAAAPARDAEAPPRRSAESLQAILASVPAVGPISERSLPASGPGEELPDFEAVYAAAGIAAPRHGFTALKVLEMLGSPQLAGLEPGARAGALLAFLQAHPGGTVSIEDVLRDAVRRDQALDAFDSALQARLRSKADQVERQNAQLQAEIDAIAQRNRQLMSENLAGVEEERARVEEWQAKKRQEEQRLFQAVSPFVEPNPVSVGNVEPATPPESGR